jgi:hypothetical protein
MARSGSGGRAPAPRTAHRAPRTAHRAPRTAHQDVRPVSVGRVSHLDLRVVDRDSDDARAALPLQAPADVLANERGVQIRAPHGLAVAYEPFHVQPQAPDAAIAIDAHGREVTDVGECQGEQVVCGHGLSIESRHAAQHVRTVRAFLALTVG